MDSVRRKPVPSTAVQPASEPKAADNGIGDIRPQPETSSYENGQAVGSTTQPQTTFKQNFDTQIDRIFPPHRRYCGLSRRIACLVVTALFLVLLALILGLAIGLSLRNRYVFQALRTSKASTGYLTDGSQEPNSLAFL